MIKVIKRDKLNEFLSNKAKVVKAERIPRNAWLLESLKAIREQKRMEASKFFKG